jgi:hypothetical protein
MGISEVEFYWVEMIAFVKIKIIVFTHPDIAALVTPLYASVKRGILSFYFSCPLYPKGREGGRAKQRPGESTMRL